MRLDIYEGDDIQSVERVEYFEVRDGYVYVERDGKSEEIAGQIDVGMTE